MDKLIEALENGPVDYGPDNDFVLVPVNVAHKIAALLRAGAKMRANLEFTGHRNNGGIVGRVKTQGFAVFDIMNAMRSWDSALGGKDE